MRHLLGIDGRDGSGKSHLAETLSNQGAGEVVLLRVDDFRSPVDWSRTTDQGTTYYDAYYDFAALNELLEGFVRGDSSGRTPVFDSVAEAAGSTRELRFDGAHTLVVEGVMLLRLAAMQRATTVYIRTSEDEARRRILARDVAKGRSADDVARRIEERYFPAQRRYHAEYDPENTAHAVLEHEVLAQPRLIRCDVADQPAVVQAMLRDALPDLAG